MSNHIHYVSNSLQLTQSMFTSTITLHVPYGVASARITAPPGSIFSDGATTKTTSGYITVCSSGVPSVWSIQDIFPYSNDYAHLLQLGVDSLSVRSTVSYSYHIDSLGYISSRGSFLAKSLTCEGNPAMNTLDIASTVSGLGSEGYLSIGYGFLTSTTQGLGSSGYISSTQLHSTVAGLGNTYISSASLISTIEGQTNYSLRGDLFSTVNGLGSYYISTEGLTSTIKGLSNYYVSSNAMISTVASFNSSEQSYLINAVNTMPYISSLSLQSTIHGLGNLYISSLRLDEFVLNFTQDIQRELLLSMVENLGTYGYISSPQIQSTVSELTLTLSSNVENFGYTSANELQSTMAGLASVFVSPLALQSTTGGLWRATDLNMMSTVEGVGGILVPTISLQSTVVGISNAYTNKLTSFTSAREQENMTSVSLISTVTNLGTLAYVSTSSLNYFFSNVYTIQSPSAVTILENTLGTTFISTAGIVSTIQGLGNSYVPTPSLISTVSGLSQTYISSPSVQSSFSGILIAKSNTLVNALQSTANGLGTLGYLSTYKGSSNSSELTSLVTSATAYTPILTLSSNAYVYFSNGYLANTSNLSEVSSTTLSYLPITVVSSIKANTFRTIGYGSNYMFGDGTYLTITSDRNTKYNIQPLSNSLESISKLRGVYYKKRDNSRRYIGCIAQEVEEVFPQVITTHPSEEPRELKSMKYEFLTAPLVESVKELARIHRILKGFLQQKK